MVRLLGCAIAFLALTSLCAEGGVVKVAINDDKEVGDKKATNVDHAEGKKVEDRSICHNVICPNSTICQEVNSECMVCGYDKRCHSGSVCNDRCNTDDQCGGDCPSCENNFCTRNKKCSSYICEHNYQCQGFGDCTLCGMDGVCHTNSGICLVACNNDWQCGGDCPRCFLGSCQSPPPQAPSPPGGQPVPYNVPAPVPVFNPGGTPYPQFPQYPQSPFPYPSSSGSPVPWAVPVPIWFPQPYPQTPPAPYPQTPPAPFPQSIPHPWPQTPPHPWPLPLPRSPVPWEKDATQAPGPVPIVLPPKAGGSKGSDPTVKKGEQEVSGAQQAEGLAKGEGQKK